MTESDNAATRKGILGNCSLETNAGAIARVVVPDASGLRLGSPRSGAPPAALPANRDRLVGRRSACGTRALPRRLADPRHRRRPSRGGSVRNSDAGRVDLVLARLRQYMARRVGLGLEPRHRGQRGLPRAVDGPGAAIAAGYLECTFISWV